MHEIVYITGITVKGMRLRYFHSKMMDVCFKLLIVVICHLSTDLDQQLNLCQMSRCKKLHTTVNSVFYIVFCTMFLPRKQ